MFDWDKDKNQKLLKERNISFEVIVSNIAEGNVVAMTPGKGKFSHQRQFIVAVNQYAYIVPFVEQGDIIFLKTIIPSRKMTMRYLSGE